MNLDLGFIVSFFWIPKYSGEAIGAAKIAVQMIC